ncbi:hypothetical protein [Mobilicoccus pelagius]|uniref:Esterase n=1 Tax=Mobilicoccus pelagius NBRC 104925 TaxID=1089455 RepID=H5UVB4_9MICO|nr:hypothetical protein [Mobilicoccus pelagius]GAB49672.1 hypothetical protein MOPEL_132_00390 [Mobilicoccus pelagius NBRC 104925]
MALSFSRRAAVALAAGAVAATVASAPPAEAGRLQRHRAAASAPTAPDRLGASYTDRAGTRSTYHLFIASVRGGRPRGLVVYLDGDGMYGHDHPHSTWALGGSRGVVAQAATRGYATLSVRTPARDATFWRNGQVNAAYVAALTESTARSLGVTDIWFVGYSGGSQLLTKHLLPTHGGRLATGGVVVTGGGGAPARGAAMPVPSRVPLLWYTGSLDDGRGTDDGYDALDDAKRGAAWYRARGAKVSRVEPTGLDHSDLGGRFGMVLARQLDRYR